MQWAIVLLNLSFLLTAPRDVIAAIAQAWVARYAAPGVIDDRPVAVAVDTSGNVYVTGTTRRTNGQDFVTVKYSSTGVQQWLSQFDGPAHGSDYAKALAVDAVGNVYVTGVSSGSGGAGADIVTIKYDTNGNQVWVARTNPGLYGNPEALAIDAAGHVYVTGVTARSATGRDYATIKYDANGAVLWTAYYNHVGTGATASVDEPIAVAVDASGNVYVTGTTDDYVSNYKYATVKYNPSGNQQWDAVFDGGGAAHAQALGVDGAGNVYVFGRGIFTTSPSYFDYATVKYDSNGHRLWVARYNGSGESGEWAAGLAVDSSGNAYVTGTSYSGTGDGLTDGSYVTVKYDASGNQAWVARYDGANPIDGVSRDTAVAIAVDQLGDVYVTGMSLPVDSNTIWFYTTPGDYVTVRYDGHTGRPVWIGRYNGPVSLWDEPVALAVDRAGNIYVTGMSAGTVTTAAPYDLDYATVKYAPLDASVVKAFDWRQWSRYAHICLDIPRSSGRIPDLPFEFPPCPQSGCRACSRTFSADLRAEPPGELFRIYGASLPLLPGRGKLDRTTERISEALRLLQSRPEGPFYDRVVKDRVTNALAEATAQGGLTQLGIAALLEAANALELEWRVPTLSVAHVPAGRSGTATFSGVATVSYREVQTAGNVRLQVKPGLPAVLPAFAGSWPVAHYVFDFSGQMAPDGSAEANLYVGGLAFDGLTAAPRLLSWDGTNFREVPARFDTRRRTLTFRLEQPRATLVVVRPTGAGLPTARTTP